MSALEQLKVKAKSIKRDLRVIYLAYRKPEVPWYAKLLGAIVVGYALSPIDLIPDFIPVLGYLDDVILIPLGITLVIKLIPAEVLAECRLEAEEIFKDGKPRNWIAGTVIILLWVAIVALVITKIVAIF